MSGETGEAAAMSTHGPGDKVNHVFFTPALESTQQRKKVLWQVQELVATEHAALPGRVMYLGQVGWEGIEQVCTLTAHIMSVCREQHLLPSEHSMLLSLHDQYQAIQLCLARINKERKGEFIAAASDVLDVWNLMYKEIVTDMAHREEGVIEECEELHLNFSNKSYDPSSLDMQEVIRSYKDFLSNSMCVDHFRLYECLKGVQRDDQKCFRDMFSKVYIIEGLEQLPLMERELLKLILEDSHVYRVSVELPFPSIAPSTTTSPIDISGIQENCDPNVSFQCIKQHIETEGSSHCIRQQTNTEGFSVHQQTECEDSSIQQQTDTEDSSIQQQTDSEGSPQYIRQQVNTLDIGTQDAGSGSVQVEKTALSLTDVIRMAFNDLSKADEKSDSEMYIERLFLAHLRLLVNTRDELALTLACSMPGREIGQQGFTDIRQEAQKKKMPMYQTILSFILRQRLGGKGYQPDPNNPILVHSKPLGEFVDALMKLQNIMEEQTDPRKGATRVLSGIKSAVVKMKGCKLRRATIEAVGGCLATALDHLMEVAACKDKNSTASQGTGQHKPSTLHPSLKHLICLCDAAAGQVSGVGIVDALGDDLLTQFSSTKKGTRTPIRIPSVLSLFRSPSEWIAKNSHCGTEEGEMKEESLLSRLKRKSGFTTPVTAQPKRYKSDCSWAPDDLSPINGDMLNLSSASPIAGPSLKVIGRTAKHTSSQDWREIVSSVTQEQEEEITTSSPYKTNSSPDTTSRGPKGEKQKAWKTGRSKRSLLKDISNMSKKDEEGAKKQRPTKSAKSKEAKRSGKEKTFLKGQRVITSFFKP